MTKVNRELELRRWNNPTIKAILDAVEDEHDDHRSCGFEIGCILTSQPLLEKLEKIISQTRNNLLREIMEEMPKKDYEQNVFGIGFNSCHDQVNTILKSKL